MATAEAQGQALWSASNNGDIATVHVILLRQDTTAATVNWKNKSLIGYTPLHAAAIYGHTPIAELLLSNNANINAKDEYGETPLHFAASNGHKTTVRLLLCHNADIFATTDSGKATCLHYAAEVGQTAIVTLLVEATAPTPPQDRMKWVSRFLSAKNTDGNTAADLARNGQFVAIVTRIDHARQSHSVQAVPEV
eukprot:m.25406 g.25406  ORF g.25406 m.25406 type:complete len:194 (+) comp13182_c1_seq3:103-684(+)